MGSSCCHKGKAEKDTAEEEEEEELDRGIRPHTFPKEILQIPNQNEEKKMMASSFDQLYTRLLSELNNFSKTDRPRVVKNHKVTLRSSEACIELIGHLKERKQVSVSSLKKIKKLGIIETLLKLLEKDIGEIRQWGTKSIYKLLVFLNEKKYKTDDLIEQDRLAELLEMLLSDRKDYIKYFALRILIFLSRSQPIHDSFLSAVIANIIKFSELRYLMKYLEKFRTLISKKEVSSEYLHTEMQDDIKRALKHFKSFKNEKDQIEYYKLVFLMKDIKYILEIYSLKQLDLPETNEKNKRRKSERKNRKAEKMKYLDRESLFNSITDLNPMKPKFHREDFFPVSCVGTQAVIYLTQALMEFDTPPKDLLFKDGLPSSLVQNLQSDSRDLVQYTIIMLSHIFPEPYQAGVTERTKKQITLILTKFLNNEIEEIRYTCGEVIRNFYAGNPTFIHNFTKTFKKIIKNSISFEQPKFFMNNLLNIQELMTGAKDELIPLGIQILSEMNIWQIVRLKETAKGKNGFMNEPRNIQDDYREVKKFLTQVKRQVPYEILTS